jgi:hypothetical protein
MRFLLPSALLSLSIVACGEMPSDESAVDTTTAPTGSTTLEVVGDWSDNYGGSTTITATKWGADTVVRFDNGANSAVVQAPADAAYNPSKFSKQLWTEPASGSFWLCTVDFGLDSADAAAASTKTADAANPADGGCGGFPWTKMTKKP